MLVASDIKAKFQSRIFTGLQRVYGAEASQGQKYSPEAIQQWQRLADAISDIAMDLVNEIQQNAQVSPGIQVVTSSGAGATISPGNIE